MDVVLASGSRWRADMLRAAGVECVVVPPDVDERAFPWTLPVEMAEGLAREKARAVARAMPAGRRPVGALVIGADQVAHVDGAILHKPESDGEHLEQLRLLRGRRHELVTGVALIRAAAAPGDELELVLHEVTGITFRGDLSDDELRAYLACGEGRDCCGGYQIEGRGAQLIESVDGDWFNVVGLPLMRVITALRSMGWRPFGGAA